ncbi:hypothetical protein [Nonomuraea sp. JJY05]|uniref:hypothetical protein n=1 Tax=Nonomuraea sp. JJY05 TaxID=3350255 RepID=UPI00373FC50D
MTVGTAGIGVLPTYAAAGVMAPVLLLAARITQTMSTESFASWGWRIPFLLAIPLSAVAVYIPTSRPRSSAPPPASSPSGCTTSPRAT